ncbi:MAG: hypothetical protein ACKPKO_49270, partial [Candidatus Fonsibacter sp.]
AHVALAAATVDLRGGKDECIVVLTAVPDRAAHLVAVSGSSLTATVNATCSIDIMPGLDQAKKIPMTLEITIPRLGQCGPVLQHLLRIVY